MTGERGPLPAIDAVPTRGVLFTDLDGTLLDQDTYAPSPEARVVVDELAAAGVLTVPVSSKTAAEVRRLRRAIRFGPVAVVEGGSAVVLADDAVEVIGPPRSQLVEILHTLQREGWPLRGFSDCTASEVAQMTGLDLVDAGLAMERVASEPFTITAPGKGPPAELERRIIELGAGMTRGGRLWHLLGREVDKGRGVVEALARLGLERRPVTGAVGDAWNDLPMLAQVQHAFLLGDLVSATEVPQGVRRIAQPGPAGFVEAGLAFLEVCGFLPPRNNRCVAPRST